jgi:hypothetical protein
MAATVSGNPTGENIESDKRTQFTYQFSPKDSEDWAYGWLDIRVVNQDGVWVVTELNLGRPKK